MKLCKIIILFSLSLSLTACTNHITSSHNTFNNSSETFITDKISSESNIDSSIAEEADTAAIMMIGDFSFSIHESKEDIFAKLDMAGLDYPEGSSPDTTKYDSYYNVNDGTDGIMQIYFLDDECVRLRASCHEVLTHTSKGIHPDSTYSQMVAQYGDSYETHTYTYKGLYTIYRYTLDKYIHEFGIAGETSNSIYNVDIYVPSQIPIYKYGEELAEDMEPL